MFKTFSSLVALSVIPSAFAAMLTLTPGEKTLEGHNIPQGAQLKLADRSVDLNRRVVQPRTALLSHRLGCGKCG